MPPLPGSPAIDTGSNSLIPSGITTDQRGEPRIVHSFVDIGAVESQGYTLAPASGSTPQTTLAGTAFAKPLKVIVTANYANDPVIGGIITFIAPTSGATAGLSTNKATIGSGNAASVNATANSILGAYFVYAETGGATSAATFSLGNTETPSLIVNTTSDAVNPYDGLTGLREAIAYAETLSGSQFITFSSTVFGTTAKTITLTGGQLDLTRFSGNLTIEGPGANLLSISGNNASTVFALYDGVVTTLSGLTVTSGNAGKYGGGGVYNQGGTLTLNNCTLSGNSATNGGALDIIEGTVTLNNCNVSGNSATYDGGGLGNFSSTATLNNCTISGNSAANDGGGLYNSDGTATLSDCTVSGNSAHIGGGGLFDSNGVANLTNTTISGNTTNFGGGLENVSDTTTLTNCTISANSATTGGGGLYDRNGTTTLKNTIVAGNTTGGDIIGSYTGSADFIGGNPMLAPLGDYGGTTLTMPPLPGSPAIGLVPANTPNTPSTDQRGFTRNTAAATDAGADQSGPTPTTLVVNTTADVRATGLLTLREAINMADVSPGNETVTFSSTVFGTTPETIILGGSQLNLTKAAGVTGSVTILGPGAGLLSVSGNNVSRVFYLNSGSTATLLRLTITGGNGSDSGGALYSKGTAALTNCVVSGNTGFDGGGGLSFFGGVAMLTNCTISNNVCNSGQGGGGLYSDGTATSLTDCTISGNSARNGGGLLVRGSDTLINCTISGNSATSGGGLYNVIGTVILDDCTVSANSATTKGGGLYNANFGTATLNNTIVAGNTTGGDLSGSYGGSNDLVGGTPLLAALGNYGGPTQTMPPLPGSTVFAAGSTALIPNSITTDQRGEPRTLNGKVDIGAVESQGYTFTASGTPQYAFTGTAFAQPLKVTVTPNYASDPINGGIITFTAPISGASAMLSATTVTIASGSVSVTATANTTAGNYAVTATAAGVLAPAFFSLYNLTPSLLVNTTSDPSTPSIGLISLREAIAYADSLAGVQTVAFSSTVFGTTAQTITLTGGALNLTKNAGVSGSVTILGAGANLLSISGNNVSRVFTLYGGGATLQSLTITGGNAFITAGGGLFSSGGSMTLANCVVTGNFSDSGGGLDFSGGVAMLTNCTVSGNVGNYGGGGLYSNGTATTLIDCTISGNSTKFNGGGLSIRGSALLINCTVSGNSTPDKGGGLYIVNGTATLNDCTVSGNSAGFGEGGGMYIKGGTVTLDNTIVAGSTSFGDLVGTYAGSNDFVGGSPLLAALGNYGGPTQTMPPLPGSPVIAVGSTSLIPNGITTDQRGEPRTVIGKVDIGAVESQGYTLTPVAGTTPQSALIGTAFANPLAVTVSPNYSNDPVNGGVITYTEPISGATATLSAGSATITGGQASVTASANTTFGRYNVSASATGVPSSANFQLTNVGLIVTSFARTSTGFTATFDEPFNLAKLHLYSTAAANLGPADVTLIGASTGPVSGSLIVSANDETITFVKTGGVLAPDTYTVTFLSTTNGFVDNTGNFLDGNADGTAGDNYVNAFTVASSTARVLAISDFARGPGQPVVIPAATGTGLPLTISDGTNVTSISLTLNYNPTLLTITGASLGTAAPSGSSVNINTSNPGVALLTFTSPTALPSGLDNFATLVASVPNAAPYASKEDIVLSNMSINGGSIAATDQDGVHVVGYLGDASGNGGYSGLDASLIARVVANIDTGFAAFPLADPTIIGDVAARGSLTAADASFVAQYVANIPQTRIPALPNITITKGGPDPEIWLPQNLDAAPGSTLTAPVLFRQTNGSPIGLDSADLAIEFDPSLFTVTGVSLGSVPQGFTLTESYDNATGAIIASLRSPSGPITLTPGTEGSLLLIDLTIRPGASLGAARLNLLGEGRVGDQVLYTSLNDGYLTLAPPPTDSDLDPTDGMVTLTAPSVPQPTIPTLTTPIQPAAALTPSESPPAVATLFATSNVAPTANSLIAPVAAGPLAAVDLAIEASHGKSVPATLPTVPDDLIDPPSGDTIGVELIPWTLSVPTIDTLEASDPLSLTALRKAKDGRVNIVPMISDGPGVRR